MQPALQKLPNGPPGFGGRKQESFRGVLEGNFAKHLKAQPSCGDRLRFGGGRRPGKPHKQKQKDPTC